MSSLTNRAIEVVDEAATETVIFNAEKQMEIHQQARKHQRIIETPEVLANVIASEVDDSDNIDVIGHSKSLIFLVCSFGVKLYTKGWKNLNAVERFMAELCSNSTVDLHDSLLMKAVGLNGQAIHDLQQKFMINELSFCQVYIDHTSLNSQLIDDVRYLQSFSLDEIIKQAKRFKRQLLKDDSSFVSPSTVEDQPFMKSKHEFIIRGLF